MDEKPGQIWIAAHLIALVALHDPLPLVSLNYESYRQVWVFLYALPLRDDSSLLTVQLPIGSTFLPSMIRIQSRSLCLFPLSLDSS